MRTQIAAGSSRGRPVAYYTPEYVLALVESAGRTMVMQPASGCWPAQIKSCWPDAPDDGWFAYDANDPVSHKIRATMKQINELELVMFKWLPLMQHVNYRCAVQYRMLQYPNTGRPIYNCTKLGRKLGQNRRRAKECYINGIQHLTDRLNRAFGSS